MVYLGAILSALVLALTFVSAHVSLTPKYAEPGQNLTTAFHIPHGCNGSATISISVTIPETITILTAQQVSNWTLDTVYRNSSSASVNTITWSGGVLPAADSIDFPVVLSVPAVDLSSQSNVTLYFPIIQTCEIGSSNWTSIPPATGEPAPTLLIVKNSTQAAADALVIKGTASASSSGAAATHSSSVSGATHLYAGVLPIAAAILAIGISLY